MIHLFIPFQIYVSVIMLKSYWVFWWNILVAWTEAGKGDWFGLFKALTWQDPVALWRSLKSPWQVRWANTALCWSFTVVFMYISLTRRLWGDTWNQVHLPLKSMSLWEPLNEKQRDYLGAEAAGASGSACVAEPSSMTVFLFVCRQSVSWGPRHAVGTLLLAATLTFSPACW